MSDKPQSRPLFDVKIVNRAIIDSFKKLDPRVQIRNPVMFVVLIGSVLTTMLFLQAWLGKGEAPAGFILAISLWLWFTVLFANFAEAMAEGRGKAQAESLRRARRDIKAKKLAEVRREANFSLMSATALRKGDVVLVEAGEAIPADGEVVEGIASPPDLPFVAVDGVLLEQVFINLLENAIKYTPAASPLAISARVLNENVVVEIADRGPGLPPAEIERVFDKFYRSRAAEGRGGVGLGLTICRSIIEAHGGRIWAENRPEGGAAFRFTLPLKDR